MNSFRHVHKAIEYEIRRHIDCLEDGEKIVQETRLFDTVKGVTLPMRGKEEAHDYRYFPDPDLVPVVMDKVMLSRWRSELPELPEARKRRFMAEHGLPAYDAEVLTAERDVADYFEAALAAGAEPKQAANWIMTELLRELREKKVGALDCALTPEKLARLLKLVESGTISGTSGKQIFAELCATGADPDTYVKDKGLAQISDTGAIEAVLDEVLAANPKELERYRGGERKLTGFFVGQVMRRMKGQANPGLVNELLARKLG
jgi:aspartyl-tRNA(Asn)/glutamyl-tRNA(Gln) amidotransferase subunit B